MQHKVKSSLFPPPPFHFSLSFTRIKFVIKAWKRMWIYFSKSCKCTCILMINAIGICYTCIRMYWYCSLINTKPSFKSMCPLGRERVEMGRVFLWHFSLKVNCNLSIRRGIKKWTGRFWQLWRYGAKRWRIVKIARLNVVIMFYIVILQFVH